MRNFNRHFNIFFLTWSDLYTKMYRIIFEVINPDPIILAYKEGYTSVQAVVLSTTKTRTQNKKKIKSHFQIGYGPTKPNKIAHFKLISNQFNSNNFSNFGGL